jgi:hypothetical protein
MNTLPSISHRLFMTLPEQLSNGPQRFYLVSEGTREKDGQATWYCEVRHGIYLGKWHYKFPEDKSALEQEIEKLDGYTPVSDTNYTILEDSWLIEMGLREPLRK